MLYKDALYLYNITGMSKWTANSAAILCHSCTAKPSAAK